MFTIRRITDPRLAERICGSFGVNEKGAFAYAAFQNDDVLATAAFLTVQGGCVTLCGADTGRRVDIPLIDGLARAAFSAQLKAGAKTACLGDGISDEIKLALSKLNYAASGEFDLESFFAKHNCCK
ncbi:hypothetical protein V6615_08835 [Oscillospiraceae bacterium PP1C4]